MEEAGEIYLTLPIGTFLGCFKMLLIAFWEYYDIVVSKFSLFSYGRTEDETVCNDYRLEAIDGLRDPN